MSEPKFGEVLIGLYASKDNPHREGFYVETVYRKGKVNPGKHYRLTDGKGHYWMYPADSTIRLWEKEQQ